MAIFTTLHPFDNFQNRGDNDGLKNRARLEPTLSRMIPPPCVMTPRGRHLPDYFAAAAIAL
jgi:hypothetical protein